MANSGHNSGGNYCSTETDSDLPPLLFDQQNDAHYLTDNGDGDDCARTVAVRRPLFTRTEFEKVHVPNDGAKRPLKKKVASMVARSKCDEKRCTLYLLSLFPFISWLRKYDFKNWLLVDSICGITIGIINIPQSMGYALLSGVEPLYGLYSSFIPTLLYVIFGTSRNMCYGTLAVTSLLVGSVVMRTTAHIRQSGAVPAWVFSAAESGDCEIIFLNENGMNESLGNATTALYEGLTPVAYVHDLNARIAICLSFITGILQLLLGSCRLGFLTVYFADAMMAGFTCATMIYAFVSQLKFLLGIHFLRPTGLFNIVRTIVMLFTHIKETNLATFLVSVIACAVLLVFKFAVNPRVMRKIRAPVPIELFVVIGAILASYYLEMAKTWKVDIIGTVRPGLPEPKLPDFKLIPNLLGEGAVVGLVNFGVSIALASVLARKHKYDIDVNQEAVSYGICNLVSSFFQAIPTGGAVASTCVEESMKGKTQIVGLIASIFMIIVLAFITQLFSTLPVCVLSAIIVVGLVGMLDRFKQVKVLWKISKFDCAIWMASFTGTVLLDVDIGLMFSILISFFIVVLRTQTNALHVLGNIPNTDIYEPAKHFKDAKEMTEIKVIRVRSPFNFANAAMIRTKLFEASGINPLKTQEPVMIATPADGLKNGDDLNQKKLIEAEKQLSVRYLVLDMASCAYVDFTGLRVIKQIIVDYKKIDVMVLLSSCNSEIREILHKGDFYAVCDPRRLFVSVHDAVLAAQRNLILLNDDSNDKCNSEEPANPVSTDDGRCQLQEESLTANNNK